MHTRVGAWLHVVTSTILLLILCGLPALAGPVTLLSRADPDRLSGTPGGESEVAALSADGRYVAFLSNADNLLFGVTDTNAGKDVFLYDRIAGTTTLVSHAAGDLSTTGNGEALSAALSADGRWVAFGSLATDLSAGQLDSDLTADLFLWDRDTGVTILVSHRPGLPTTAAGGFVGAPELSADGSRIAFTSNAPDLVAGQTDGYSTDAFLYDRAANSNVLVSHASDSATTAAAGVAQSRLSADGNWVAFVSWSVNIVAGQVDDPGGTEDLFLYDSVAGTNVLVSHAAGLPATAVGQWSASPQISADGGWIAYHSYATNLVAGQLDGNNNDVFLYDRATGTNALVSHAVSSATTAGNSYSAEPTLSADGRYVAYWSGATDLVAEDTGYWDSVFFYDRVAGTNTLVSRGSTMPDSNSACPRLSSDGAWVVFMSGASNLIPGQIDPLYTWDTFLWSHESGSITLVTRTPDSAITATGAFSPFPRINADGSWIALDTDDTGAESLVDGIEDYNGLNDVYLYERATGRNTLITLRGGAVSAAAGGFISDDTGAALSNDGRFIAFTSPASNLRVPGLTDGNSAQGALDVFLVDRNTGATTLVSHASDSPSITGNSSSFDPLLSADGSIVVFRSTATNLVPGQVVHGSSHQLFLFQRTTGAIVLVSRSARSQTMPAGGGYGECAVSGDGRWIAFSHTGSDLVAGQVDDNGTRDIFLFDRMTGMNILVSHASSSPAEAGNGGSVEPSISADGRYVVFVSSASNLVPGQDSAGGIFLYDRVTGTTTRAISWDNNLYPQISADGRWVVFVSDAPDLVPGQVDPKFGFDVFLWDRVSGTTQLVSHTPASPVTTGNSGSELPPKAPVLSADGRWWSLPAPPPTWSPGRPESRPPCSSSTGSPGP